MPTLSKTKVERKQPVVRRAKGRATPVVQPQNTESRAQAIIDSIRNGKMDAHLRPIARACFARRDELRGTTTVVDTDSREFIYSLIEKGVKSDQELREYLRSLDYNVVQETVLVAKPPSNDSRYNGEPIASSANLPPQHVSTPKPPPLAGTPNGDQALWNSAPILPIGTLAPVRPRKRLSGAAKQEIVTWNGKRYYRSDIVGHKFTIPFQYRTKALAGIDVYVAGLGPQSFKLMLVERPNSQRGSYYQKWLRDEPLFLPRNVVFNWLVNGPSK